MSFFIDMLSNICFILENTQEYTSITVHDDVNVLHVIRKKEKTRSKKTRNNTMKSNYILPEIPRIKNYK
jgi:predicted DsbA family dithiol-disulfide isomerase